MRAEKQAMLQAKKTEVDSLRGRLEVAELEYAELLSEVELHLK